MPSIRNVSDRDLEVGGLIFPAGSATDVSDEWAKALLTNPNFEAVKAKPAAKAKGDNDTPTGQEG